MRHVRLGFVALGQAGFVVLLNPRAAVQPRQRAEDNIELVGSHDLQRRSPGMLCGLVGFHRRNRTEGR